MTIRVILLGCRSRLRAQRPQIHQIHHIVARSHRYGRPQVIVVAERQLCCGQAVRWPTAPAANSPRDLRAPEKPGGRDRFLQHRSCGYSCGHSRGHEHEPVGRFVPARIEGERGAAAPAVYQTQDARPGNHAARYAAFPEKSPTIAIVTRALQPVFLRSPALPAVPAARHSRSCGGLHANIYAVNCKYGMIWPNCNLQRS